MTVGMPFDEVKETLQNQNIDYITEITRPVRNLFKTDEDNLYVIREKYLPDGKLLLTLAAKQCRQ